MRGVLYAAITSALLIFPAIAIQVEYFPPASLDESPQSSLAIGEQYSTHLNALEEPSLWESSKTKKAETYRFLWLRTFDHPIAVRLDVNSNGTSTLTTKITTGKGGYKPGKILVNRKRPLTQDETAWVIARFNELGFWDLPAYEKPHESVGPDGVKYADINLDGAQWVLEGVKDGKYHVTRRWSPENGPVRTLGIIMLIDIAKLKLLYQDVY